MALIMLAIGGLLALVGVYAIASGFPVIEVERGWSMVISGAVLLSGGLIVAALGIVVRTIDGLKTGFPIAAVPGLAPHEPSLAPPVEAPRAPAFEPAPVDARAPTIAVAVPPAAAVLAAGAGHAASLPDSEAHEADLTTHHEPEPTAPEPVDQAPAEHTVTDQELFGHEPPVRAPFGQAWHEQDFSAFDLDAPHETATAHTPEPAVAPAPHVPEPTPTESHEPEIHERPIDPPPEPAFHEPEPVAAHIPEPKPEPEPVAEAPSTAPETPPGGLSVIGRYDSDGTSYVMYSDGSIEAQSEAGVFRFNSMAELKAFIEG